MIKSMILSDRDIEELIELKKLLIEPFEKSNLRESSIKLHLSDKLFKYKDNSIADLKDDTSFVYDELNFKSEGYLMEPGEFLLSSTLEKITIPNGFMGWIETRGSIARAGIQAHLCDAHIDPGSSLNITLQLKNMSNHKIKIYPYFYFIKLYIFQMTTNSDKPYSGKYQDSINPTVYIKE